MPADKPINLRLARKRKARETARAAGDANAAAHGVPKPIRALAEARTEKAERDLDGKKREQ